MRSEVRLWWKKILCVMFLVFVFVGCEKEKIKCESAIIIDSQITEGDIPLVYIEAGMGYNPKWSWSKEDAAFSCYFKSNNTMVLKDKKHPWTQSILYDLKPGASIDVCSLPHKTHDADLEIRTVHYIVYLSSFHYPPGTHIRRELGVVEINVDSCSYSINHRSNSYVSNN